MPPILVSSFAKRIATQILVIAKLNRRKDFTFTLEVLFVISSVPAMNYLFKVSNWSTRIRCENCSRLRMKTLERCQWRHSSVFIVNCEHISSLVQIADLNRQTSAGFILKIKTLLKTKLGISCVMLLYFQCEQNLLTNGI